MFAAIPSPPNPILEIGPLEVHYYGILIGLGVLGAFLATQRRFARYGGDPAIVEKVTLWAVVWGFVGARVGYVITHTARFESLGWQHVLYIWEGGLAFFGGLTGGAIAALVIMRRLGADPWTRDFARFADGAAVGIPLAQAIGRWGNYFNQELFGTPSDLPWAVEIDARIAASVGYPGETTFHPTFLYESLWNLVLTIPVVLVVERSGRFRRGALIFVYLTVYGTGRFLMELLRTDTSFRLLGLSRNGWIAAAAAIAGLLILRRFRVGEPAPVPEEAVPGSE